MKASILIVAALSLVSGQKKEDYFPECSLNCLNDGTKKATDCSLTDAVCWCVQSNYEAIYDAAVSCVMAACGAGVSVEKVLPAAIDFCSAASSLASATATASGSSATGSSATGSSVPSSAAATPTGSSASGGSSATSTSASAQATDTGAAAALGGSIPVMVAAGLVALL
uniref:CFEM domain-containing protein n=1 Tax=Bionectria ochroleuca TaxID=29856 RepID=A0A8H7KCX5_BIOOC